ncbi:MAG: carboxypeptidase regulatory-like domain-containing protein [Acidobacteria bacterium]|nr:carboxypeptidase regulatory-like domain-containing protein [Acidobacteriota bacterium]
MGDEDMRYAAGARSVRQDKRHRLLGAGGVLAFAVLALVGAVFLAVSSRAAAPVQLVRLSVSHEAGAVRVELIADSSLAESAVEQERRGDETIVRVRGARSLLLPSYAIEGLLVRRLRTASGLRGGEPFVEIFIDSGGGATVAPQKSFNRLVLDITGSGVRADASPRPERSRATSASGVGAAPRGTGALRGRITDELGALIVGATVALAGANGSQLVATTDEEGAYNFSGLPDGRYVVRAAAPGFAVAENADVELGGGRKSLDLTLRVALEHQQVTVAAEAPLSTELDNNAGALVLRGADLDALPDDPEGLAEAVQSLAGPGGGQVLVDGFTDGRLPPKNSIREIRVNQNPFSAQYDRMGYGRVEVQTKPGADEFRGQGFFNFNDESLNARNAFAPNRAHFQSRLYGGSFSGPVIAKKASFFLDFERNEADENAVINATVLDTAFSVTPFSQTVRTPQCFTNIGTRFDYQLGRSNTLTARYNFSRSTLKNAGIGDLSLPSRAFDRSGTEQSLQLTDTAALSGKVVNEARFQYARTRRRREGDNSVPTIRVIDAFTGGGAQVGVSFNNEDRWELQNYTSWALGRHAFKAGGRLRGVSITDVSPQNFGGTFTFGGGVAPELDANGGVVRDANGQPVFVPITSLERYRRTVLLGRQELTPAEIRERGGGATQFSIAGGNPLAGVRQVEFGGFLQDDWRLRPNLTIGLGLRYEAQSNVGDWTNFAPRLAFAWAPGTGGARQPKTVIRGGFGLFYERFGENLTLQVNRFNGTNQQQFIVSDPTVLDLYRDVPSITTLTAFAVPQTTRRVAEDLRAPYSLQSSLSVERRLPFKTTLSATYLRARVLHVLRSRNVNAPLPGTFVPGRRGSGVRPFGGAGNVFQYESSGTFNQNQLIVTANNRFNRNLTFFATYVLNKASTDSGGAESFPADTYDLSTEYGRSAIDIRHHFSAGGSLTAPWGLRLNPFVVASSGYPFNITTGRDTNGDSLFTERPAFATDLTKPGIVFTRFGAFDPEPAPGQRMIPRNYGEGLGFFSVNLRVTKTFGFGGGPRGASARAQERYNLLFSLQVQNLFNHTNLGSPVGNLSSPFFGQPYSTAGDGRRVEAQTRFSF